MRLSVRLGRDARPLRRAKPRVFADLAALNALYRPGALDAGTVEDYVRRRGGTSRVTYPLPELEPILAETLGILVYQEQVMRIAQVVAGYSLAEADLLRKAIGKKKREIMLAEGEKFRRRCVEHGTPMKKAQELWALIEPFARYGFNKSHAVAYALVVQDRVPQSALPGRLFRGHLSAEIGSTDGSSKSSELWEWAFPSCPRTSRIEQEFHRVGTRSARLRDQGVGAGAGRSCGAEKGGFVSSRTSPAAWTRAWSQATWRVDCAGAFAHAGASGALSAAPSGSRARPLRVGRGGQSSLFAETPRRASFSDGFREEPNVSGERLKGDRTSRFYVTGTP